MEDKTQLWRELAPVKDDGTFDIEKAHEQIPYSDVMTAEYIVRRLGGMLTWEPNEQQWRRWDGMIHEAIPAEAASHVLDEFAHAYRAAMKKVEQHVELLVNLTNGSQAQDKERKKWAAKWKEHQFYLKRLFSDGGQGALLRQLRLKCVVDGQDFDKYTCFFVVENGTLDFRQILRDGLDNVVVYSHEPSHLITRKSPIYYDPMATCPHWLEYLESSLPNEEVRRYVQKWAGAALLGEPKNKGVVNLTGEPDTGKSVFINTMLGVFGGYGTVIRADAFLKKAQGDQGFDIHEAKGFRFVSTTEPDQNRSLDAGTIKQVTGEDFMRTRTLNQRSKVAWKPQCTVFIASNHAVKMDTSDKAMVNRLKPIRFPVQFYREDNGLGPMVDLRLGEKLELEQWGIFNWLLEGLMMYWDEGLGSEPTEVTIEREEIATEGESALQWLEAVLQMDNPPITVDHTALSSHCLPVQIAYENYNMWAIMHNGYKYGPRKFNAVLYRKYPKTQSNSATRFFGLRVDDPRWQNTVREDAPRTDDL